MAVCVSITHYLPILRNVSAVVGAGDLCPDG